MADSFDSYFPFDAGAGASVAEDGWRSMARHWARSGVLPGELNELEVYGDSSGMQVKVKTGRAFVRGHYCENTSEVTLPIATYVSSRYDAVIARADFVNNRVELEVLTGPGGATLPTLTQNSSKWEILLALVLVDTGTSIAAGKVIDGRQFSAANGGLIVTSSGDPSASGVGDPYDGMWRYDRTLDELAIYNGSAWKPFAQVGARTLYTPTWAGSAAVSLGNGIIKGRYRISSVELSVHMRLTWGSTTSTTNATSWTFTIPSGLTMDTTADVNDADAAIGSALIKDSSTGLRYRGVVRKASSTTVTVLATDGSTAVAGYQVPFTWASGDLIDIDIPRVELA